MPAPKKPGLDVTRQSTAAEAMRLHSLQLALNTPKENLTVPTILATADAYFKFLTTGKQ